MKRPLFLTVSAGLLGALCLLAPAQRGASRPGPKRYRPSLNEEGAPPRTALEALEAARKIFRIEVNKVVDLRGGGGNPAPAHWGFMFHDPRSRSLLGIIEPGERPEPADNFYADGKPPIFFDVARVRTDSPEAFKIANAMASDAKIGFDSLDYLLRGREFSGEPVWTLRLFNRDEEIVGIVELSAESGKVLRTVWVRPDRERGGVRVVDSALTGGSAAVDPSIPLEELEPKPLPPLKNLEPPADPPKLDEPKPELPPDLRAPPPDAPKLQ